LPQKHDQLIKTGEVLFIKHGMRRVTVVEICNQANVSKPTFYKYFENKEALARRIVESWIDEALELIDEIEEADLPFPEKLKRMLAIKQELSVRPGPEFFEDLIPLDIDLSHAMQRVVRFLMVGQHNGDIRADIRPEVLMASFNLLNSMQHNPRIRGLYDDLERLAADVFKLFYYGALSKTHREKGLPDSSDGLLLQD
jgi:AcrR family transcriptional regulator